MHIILNLNKSESGREKVSIMMYCCGTRKSHPWTWIILVLGWDFLVPHQYIIFFFQKWSCGISNRRGWRTEQIASKIYILGSNWRPWGEVKGQISLNSGYHVNFKDFLYQTVCVFSQMKDTKHFRRDFYSVSWVMPQGWDFEGDDEQDWMQVTFLSEGQTGDLGARSKGQISLTCHLHVSFIPNCVCVLTNKR